jgi:hypothetical protein
MKRSSGFLTLLVASAQMAAAPLTWADDFTTIPGAACQVDYFGADLANIDVGVNGFFNRSDASISVACPIVRDNIGTGKILERLEVSVVPGTSCTLFQLAPTGPLTAMGWGPKSLPLTFPPTIPVVASKLIWTAGELPSNRPGNALVVHCELEARGVGMLGGGVRMLWYREP